MISHGTVRSLGQSRGRRLVAIPMTSRGPVPAARPAAAFVREAWRRSTAASAPAWFGSRPASGLAGGRLSASLKVAGTAAR